MVSTKLNTNKLQKLLAEISEEVSKILDEKTDWLGVSLEYEFDEENNIKDMYIVYYKDREEIAREKIENESDFREKIEELEDELREEIIDAVWRVLKKYGIEIDYFEKDWSCNSLGSYGKWINVFIECDITDYVEDYVDEIKEEYKYVKSYWAWGEEYRLCVSYLEEAYSTDDYAEILVTEDTLRIK